MTKIHPYTGPVRKVRTKPAPGSAKENKAKQQGGYPANKRGDQSAKNKIVRVGSSLQRETGAAGVGPYALLHSHQSDELQDAEPSEREGLWTSCAI